MTFIVPTWSEDRACVGIPVELFYDTDNTEAVEVNNRLRRLCEGCAALAACRQWARLHEEFGFWGGESASARRKWRQVNGVRLNRLHTDGGFVVKEGAA